MKRVAMVVLVAVLAACSKKEQPSPSVGNAKHGRELIDQYGCTACHSIPRVAGPKGMVGPALDHIGTRTMIAGKFPNKPDILIRWLQNPQAMDPGGAMPNLGISPSDAHDIAAFLYTLR